MMRVKASILGRKRKNEMKIHLHRLSTILVTSLLMIGCNISQESTTIQTPTPTHSQKTATTSKESRTATQPMTLTPSKTVSPTPTPTWTPVSTLPPGKQIEIIQELLSNNGGCTFPCWWGISPGDTMQDVLRLSQTIGESPQVWYSTLSYVLTLYSENSIDFDISFKLDKSGFVKSTEVTIDSPYRLKDLREPLVSQLSLSAVLSQYGKPSRVLLLVTPFVEPPEPHESRVYVLFLLYEDLGFGITYWGNVDLNDPVRICSLKVSDYQIREISFYVQDLEDIIARTNVFHPGELMPIDHVTSMTIDDFYRSFLPSDNDECIETDIKYWEE